MDVFNSYENKNYLVLRTKPYNPSGRHQTQEESDALGEPIKNLLKDRNINFECINGDKKGYEKIISDILEHLKLFRKDGDSNGNN